MNTTRPWWRSLLVAGLAAGIIWLVVNALSGPKPAKHGLSNSQERHTEAAGKAAEKQAYADTARAARLDTTAGRAYDAGQALARNARQYQRLTRPHHAPLPAAPAAAALDSLQRILSAY